MLSRLSHECFIYRPLAGWEKGQGTIGRHNDEAILEHGTN